MIGGRASGGVDRLRVCNGMDFRRETRSDFKVLSGSFRPARSISKYFEGSSVAYD